MTLRSGVRANTGEIMSLYSVGTSPSAFIKMLSAYGTCMVHYSRNAQFRALRELLQVSMQPSGCIALFGRTAQGGTFVDFYT